MLRLQNPGNENLDIHTLASLERIYRRTGTVVGQERQKDFIERAVFRPPARVQGRGSSYNSTVVAALARLISF